MINGCVLFLLPLLRSDIRRERQPRVARNSSIDLYICPYNLRRPIRGRPIIHCIRHFPRNIISHRSHFRCEERQIHVQILVTRSERYLRGYESARVVGGAYLVCDLEEGVLYAFFVDERFPGLEGKDVQVSVSLDVNAERGRRPAVGKAVGAVNGRGLVVRWREGWRSLQWWEGKEWYYKTHEKAEG